MFIADKYNIHVYIWILCEYSRNRYLYILGSEIGAKTDSIKNPILPRINQVCNATCKLFFFF